MPISPLNPGNPSSPWEGKRWRFDTESVANFLSHIISLFDKCEGTDLHGNCYFCYLPGPDLIFLLHSRRIQLFNDQSRKVKNASWCRLVSIFTRRNETLMTQEQCISRRHTHTHTHTHTHNSSSTVTRTHSEITFSPAFPFSPRTPSAPCRQKERKSKRKKINRVHLNFKHLRKRSPEIDCITNTD